HHAVITHFIQTYFNTSSSKCIYDILKEIKFLKERGKNVRVRWYYEQYDEDMMEAGEDYSDLLDLPFAFIEIPEFEGERA
ncbi:MAG: SiaC family regulatory phosphoprotein, partial [Bacteroidota bacterium]